jgi:hypothetical protein
MHNGQKVLDNVDVGPMGTGARAADRRAGAFAPARRSPSSFISQYSYSAVVEKRIRETAEGDRFAQDKVGQ